MGLGLLIVKVLGSYSDTPHFVGFFWTSDRPVTETDTDIRTFCRIRTRIPSTSAPAAPHRRPRGRRDQL